MRGEEFLRCGDAERSRRAGQAEEVGGDVLAGEGEGLSVLGAEEPTGGGVERACEAAGEAAFFEHLKKAQPHAVGGEEGEADGGGFFAAREHGGEESFGVGEEKDERRAQKDDGKDDVHGVLYDGVRKIIIKSLTNGGGCNTMKV